jgi:hypothetical protein
LDRIRLKGAEMKNKRFIGTLSINMIKSGCYVSLVLSILFWVLFIFGGFMILVAEPNLWILPVSVLLADILAVNILITFEEMGI